MKFLNGPARGKRIELEPSRTQYMYREYDNKGLAEGDPRKSDEKVDVEETLYKVEKVTTNEGDIRFLITAGSDLHAVLQNLLG